MKIYIVGSVASGKSTLAKRISTKTGTPFFSLDEVVHEKDDTKELGNCKRTPEERDALFTNILALSAYILEDTGRECFEDGLKQAEFIILLEIPLVTRQYRIIFRYIRQKLGIEKCVYRPSLQMVRYMFKWAKNYDNGKDGVHDRVMKYADKVIILKSNLDIERYIRRLEKSINE